MEGAPVLIEKQNEKRVSRYHPIEGAQIKFDEFFAHLIGSACLPPTPMSRAKGERRVQPAARSPGD